MNSIFELIEQRAASTDAALIDGTSKASVRWREVLDTCEMWEGSDYRGPVGLALADPLSMAVHTMAALASGVVVAPLDPSAPARAMALHVDELGLSCLFTDGPTIRRPRVVRFGSARTVPEVPADPALIMASSGSTGKAKIVPLTVDQLTSTAQGVASHLELAPGERAYSPLPLFHINGIVVGLLSALVADSVVVLDRRFSRQRFWDTVRSEDVTWINTVPAILAILAGSESSGGPRPGQVRLARSASAPLPQAVRRRFESKYSIPVVETYGMTEAASQITANPLQDVRAGSVGKPVGVELRVVDELGGSLEVGGTGRVEIRGRAVVDTYWKTAPGADIGSQPAIDRDGWLTTGDLGRLDADGYLYLTGRESEIINRGGEKIRPREVEEILLEDERVEAAVVVGINNPTVGEEPVAYVQATAAQPDGYRDLEAQLMDRCRNHLSSYKRPVAIHLVDSLPAGPTGKVRRAEVGRMTGSQTPQPHRNASAAKYGESIFVDLPPRPSKPRQTGVTMAIDSGIAQGAFADWISTAHPYIDLVKFGWGTALVTPDIEKKFAVLRQQGIDYYFGGTLFEKFAYQGRFESFLTLCRLCDCRYVEISDGTVEMSSEEKAVYIRRCSDAGFIVLSEVGFKDAQRSDLFTPQEWVAAIRSDLSAGAHRVITEARESGKAGLCHRDGSPRDEAVQAILASDIDPSRLIFEAPTKDLQAHFIVEVGPDVNLGNIAPSDVIGLETLRLGLRSDTLLSLEPAPNHA